MQLYLSTPISKRQPVFVPTTTQPEAIASITVKPQPSSTLGNKKISDSLYKEMIDVAETCLSLEKYKKWVESLPESDFKSEKLKKIKKDLKYVQKTIKTTISEVEF